MTIFAAVSGVDTKRNKIALGKDRKEKVAIVEEQSRGSLK